MVRRSNVKLLRDPKYTTYDEISRTIHLKDFYQCLRKNRLLSHKISNSSVDPKVLWFSPVTDVNDHNFYGNITFKISLDTFSKRFGTKLNTYYVDQEEMPNRTYTRVLLTPKLYDNLRVVNNHQSGFAMDFSQGACITAAISGNNKFHALEIGIEVTNDDCKWLFESCKKFVTEHSSPNCHRYISFNMKCPTLYSISTTISKLYSRFNIDIDQNSQEIFIIQKNNSYGFIESLGCDNEDEIYSDVCYNKNYDNHDNCYAVSHDEEPPRLSVTRPPQQLEEEEEQEYEEEEEVEEYEEEEEEEYEEEEVEYEEEEEYEEEYEEEEEEMEELRVDEDVSLSTGEKVAIGVGVAAIGAGLAALFSSMNKNNNKK